ncbi:hypothetical protein MMEU_5215 [Mycobacterium marinum str. Europe]|nr:hypothetical protein MMEU_5215 [Mycobacterium marinum str. Europe]
MTCRNVELVEGAVPLRVGQVVGGEPGQGRRNIGALIEVALPMLEPVGCAGRHVSEGSFP